MFDYIHLVFVTWARVVCLICTPSALGPAALRPRGIHIRQTTRAHVTNTKCIPPNIMTTNLFGHMVMCTGVCVLGEEEREERVSTQNINEL